MWLIGHIVDAAAIEDMHMVKERLALLIVAIEQSVTDGGDWSLAFLLSLAEDPPLAVFQERSSSVSPYGKPFSALVPPSWAAIVIAYIKELEVLNAKKPDIVGKSVTKAADPTESPSPRRRVRFPRKPKADGPPKGQ